MIKLHLLYTNILPASEKLEETLWIIIFAFLAGSVLMFISIMLFRTIRIADEKHISYLKEIYSGVFMEAAFASENELNAIITKAVELNKTHLTRKKYADTIIEELMLLYNSFTGESKQNLRKLYLETGFLAYSEKKIKSYKWEIQAQGIREVAQMKDNRMLHIIEKLVNHKNTFVKENAQLCLVKISGFEGLNFLSAVNTSISDWQQINLIDALKEYHYIHLPKLSIWLSSSEKTVILFAIRLMSYYNQIDDSHKLIGFLNYSDKKIKTEAIRALKKLSRRDAIPHLENIYNNESVDIKIEIIRAYAGLADPAQTKTLVHWLTNAADMEIQIECVRAIMELGGSELLSTIEFKNETLAGLVKKVTNKTTV